jgi:hypothetical protein
MSPPGQVTGEAISLGREEGPHAANPARGEGPVHERAPAAVVLALVVERRDGHPVVERPTGDAEQGQHLEEVHLEARVGQQGPHDVLVDHHRGAVAGTDHGPGPSRRQRAHGIASTQRCRPSPIQPRVDETAGT